METKKVRVITGRKKPQRPLHVETLPVCEKVKATARVKVNIPTVPGVTSPRVSSPGPASNQPAFPQRNGHTSPGLPPRGKTESNSPQRGKPESNSPQRGKPEGLPPTGQRSPQIDGLPPKPGRSTHKPQRQKEIYKQSSRDGGLQYAQQCSRDTDAYTPASPPVPLNTHEPTRIQSILHRRVSLNESSQRAQERRDTSNDKVTRILEGFLDHLPPITSKTVRVFLSSTFSDMVQERNALMECVYPRLKDICREQFGLEFQVVDLRWGVREEAQDDHATIDVCLQEIDNCKNSSIGPSFVAFIGQKYGYRPFPPKIKASEFSVLRDVLVRDGRDVTLLDKWYRVDRNMIPSVCILQPISSLLKHYNHKTNTILREADQAEWNQAFSSLQSLLRRAAELARKKGIMSEKEMEKYFVSVTELEIERGMMELHDPNSNCFCFYRNIRDLENKVLHKRSQKFIDMSSPPDPDPVAPFDPPAPCVDVDAQNLLHMLKKRKIESCLTRRENFENFDIDWGKDNERMDPNDDPRYLQKFCKAFTDNMYELIRRKQSEIQDLQNNTNLVEVLQHSTMCRWRSEIFRGREDVLGSVLDYLYHPASEPLVIYGESGSGKTSVMAKAASLIHRKWFKDDKYVVIMRYLGTTVRSCSIRLVLGSLCWQIATLYGCDHQNISQDYPKLVRHFHSLLNVATADRPLVIFLDSLDQLSPSHRAHNLAWLPLELPKHVHVVISTLPDMYGLLQHLQTLIRARDNFIQILPLGTQLCMDLVKEWLRGANRTLTNKQFDTVRAVLDQCTLPLYTKLIFEEVCRWKSYSPPEQTVLENSVKGVINTLFDRVERYHGQTFVKHALSYLTASKNGLSDNELEDLLSIDDMVLDDVFQHWLPPIRRIPPLLWPRLLNELGSYIMKREANGIIVFYWYHRQFIKAAQERFLSNLGHQIYIHTTVAHYFLGTWGGGAQKAFVYTENHLGMLGRQKKESLADRKVPPQPLIFCADPSKPNKVVYNLRKLSELPYHLLLSRRFTEMKSQVLFNYEWLHSKLSSMGLQDVLSDFRSVMEAGEKEPDIALVGSALRVGGSYVNQNPNTLSFDLTGRLLPYYNDHHNIRYLLQQCDALSLTHSSMVPLYQCFEAPKRMLLYVLEDHSQVVYDILFSKLTNEIVSVSKDNTIAFWDLNFGERTRSIDISMVSPGLNTKLYQSADGKYLLVDSDYINSPVLIFDTKTGLLKHTVGKRTNMLKRAFLSGNLFCRQKNIIDVRSGKIIKTLDDYVETKRFVMAGTTPNEKYILIGEEHETKMFDLETHVCMARFPANNMPCQFVFTPDSRQVFIGYTGDCLLKVCDVKPSSPTFGQVLITFNYKQAFPNMKFLDGALYHQELAEIALCEKNPNLVLLNVKRCYLILFNLMTQNAKLLDVKTLNLNNNTLLFGISFSMDGRFIIAGASDNLHVWSTENCKLVSTITIHTNTRFPMALCVQNNLIATGSNIHTAIKVWDLNKVQAVEPGSLVKYGNPVNMVACAPDRRLVFVKHFYGFTSTQGYKYHTSFGIDVWNMSTGTSKSYLPFGNYGSLLQMDVSPDGQKMALLLSCREESYLLIIGIKPGKASWTLLHPNAKSFAISPNWDFAATCASERDIPETILWSLTSGDKVRSLLNTTSPVFSLDNCYLLYILNKDVVITFSLKAKDKVASFDTRATVLCTVPTCPHVVMVMETASPHSLTDHSIVTLWYYHNAQVCTKLYGVAPKGIKDISKDGLRAVDGYLQVFDLKTGHLLCRFEPDNTHMHEFVQMSYDSRLVIWTDDLSLRVGDIKSCQVIGNISLHEKPTSLTLMDYGYVVVIGREDGHLVTLKIMNKGDEKMLRGVELATLDQRTGRLLEIPACSDGVIATFDALYRKKAARLKDSEMPKLSDEVHHIMEQKAKVPHAIIKTASHGDLHSLDGNGHIRRGSTPCYLKDPSRSGTSTPSSGTPVSGSPVLLRKKRSDRHRSKSTQGDMDNQIGTFSKKKSCSLQDLFHLGKATSSPKTPTMTSSRSREDKKTKRKSPLMTKALHHTGNFFMALTDIGSSRSLPRKAAREALKAELAKDNEGASGGSSTPSPGSSTSGEKTPRRKSYHSTTATDRGRSPSM